MLPLVQVAVLEERFLQNGCYLIIFYAEITFQIFSLPDSTLSLFAEMIVTQTLLTVCALQGWPRIILYYSHKLFIIFIKSHRFLP